jgi:O-antigen/teichoic acid export membrane protein
LLYGRIDSVLISRMIGLGAVAQYSIGLRLSERAYLFSTHLSRALTPVMAEIQGRGDLRDMHHIHYRGAKLTTAFATPFLLGLALLAGPLIEVWAGPGFEDAIPACQLLLAGSMILVIHASSANYLAMSGHESFLARANLMAQVVHVGFSLVLIPLWGIQGAAMASLLATAPLCLLVLQSRVDHLEGVGSLHYYRETVLPSAVPAVLMGVPLHGLARSGAITSIFHVAGAELLALAVFFAAFWVVGLADGERGFLGARLRDAVCRIRSAFQTAALKT